MIFSIGAEISFSLNRPHANIKLKLQASALGLVAPWLLLLSLLSRKSWEYRRFAIVLFFTMFGSVILLGTGDGHGYQILVEQYYAGISFEQFLSDSWRVVTFQITESGAKDLYQHTVSYIFGNLLEMPRLFFPFVAFVYGYFYAGSIVHVLDNFNVSKSNYVVLIFVGIFVFAKGMEGFYTVRTWTGLWILVYSCLKYHESKRHRYLILMFVAPLVHLGYFLLAIPAWLVLVFGSRPKIYFLVFLLSSVTTVIPVTEVTSAMSKTERGEHQVQGYLVDKQADSVEEFGKLQEETNWYNAYRRAGLQRWAPTVLVFTLVLSGIYTNVMGAYQKRIFSIGLLTLAFSNMTWFLFAVHNRSLTIAIVFLLAAFLMTRLDSNNHIEPSGRSYVYRLGLHLSMLLFLPLILFNLSITLERMSVFMFGLPFLVWLDPEINMSVKEFLNLVLARG